MSLASFPYINARSAPSKSLSLYTNMAVLELLKWIVSIVLEFNVQPTTLAVLGIASLLFIYKKLGTGTDEEPVFTHDGGK